MTKQKLICSYCGSYDYARDAWASWDAEKQEFKLLASFDDGKCFNCERDGRGLWVDVPDAQDTAYVGVTGSHWFPADNTAEERAQTTGEDTRCCNCRGMFSEHTNSRCTKT